MNQINVNKKVYSVDTSPDTPLLWVLRDHLQLTGTKYGCGQGLCGACTIHLDGEPVRACITPLSQLNNRNITTIEGLSNKKLQQAWIDNNVPQCGYCQSGQLMSADALLSSIPNPNDNDINNALSGNICRCGTYNRIRAAIHQAAGQTSSKQNIQNQTANLINPV